MTTIVGIGILVWSLHGTRVGRESRCRKCAFELTGLESAERCPECGTDLSHPRARVRGFKQRRWIVACAATLLVLVSALYLGVRSPGVPTLIASRLPDGVLVSLADVGFEGAHRELDLRLSKGALASATTQRLADAALRRQSDFSRRFDRDWAETLETIRAAGNLTPAQFETFARNIVGVELFHRDVLIPHEDVPVGARFHMRRGPWSQARNPNWLQVDLHWEGVRIDALDSTPEQAPASFRVHSRSSSAHMAVLTLPEAPSPGSAEMELTLHVRVSVPATTTSASWRIEASERVRVLEENVPPITLTSASDPERIAAQLIAMPVRVRDTPPSGQNQALIACTFMVNRECVRKPTDLAGAFRVLVRTRDGSVYPCGSVLLSEKESIRPAFSTSLWSHDLDTIEAPEPWTIDPGETVDVFLQPDRMAAYRDPRVHEIPDVSLIFVGVPIETMRLVRGRPRWHLLKTPAHLHDVDP